ncbi:hypothetical protein ES702_00706 [subsurface metagenome]
MEFKLVPVDRLFYDNEIKKRLSYFKLIPVSKEHYDNEIIISIKKKGDKFRQQKFDELEIAYYKRIGIKK